MLHIAHRPEVVAHANRIVRLEAGAAVPAPARWAA
jgi:ABC-type transport system involved in cytochrome bd biosynthesis fused ATPase/permease subunit